MNELPLAIKKAANRYKNIKIGQLTVYPILVKDYDEFLIARQGLEVLHQSLPTALWRMPLLSALYRLDYEALMQKKAAPGLFACALIALSLALRLGEDLELNDRIKQFRLVVKQDEPQTLLKLQFADIDGEIKEILPVEFANLRQVIAVQNGIKLESDTANPDIVKAERNGAGNSAVKLDTDIEDLISAVATVTQTSESEIDNWPILKLNRHAESLRRMLDYLICGMAECSGTTWKNGNPTPHPFYKAIKNSSILSVFGSSAADDNNSAPLKEAAQFKELTQKL